MSATIAWACAYCGRTFNDKAAAVAHEARSHDGEARPRKRFRRHQKLTAKCEWCGILHTPSKHKSHGRGSFARTHGGQRKSRKTGGRGKKRRSSGNPSVREMNRLLGELAAQSEMETI